MSEHKNNFALHYVIQRPEIMTSDTRAIILLHGIGGNEFQLFNFAHELPQDHLILAVRAPFTVAAGSYTWFNVDFVTPAIDHAQAEKSRQLLKQFVEQVHAGFNISYKNIFLLGFSQGSIMSFSIGLTHPELMNGIIALSGRILPEIILKANKSTPALKKLRVFLGHGVYDPTLSIIWARHAKDYLEKLQVKLTYREYNIWHEVADEELAEIIDFIRSV